MPRVFADGVLYERWCLLASSSRLHATHLRWWCPLSDDVRQPPLYVFTLRVFAVGVLWATTSVSRLFTSARYVSLPTVSSERRRPLASSSRLHATCLRWRWRERWRPPASSSRYVSSPTTAWTMTSASLLFTSLRYVSSPTTAWAMTSASLLFMLTSVTLCRCRLLSSSRIVLARLASLVFARLRCLRSSQMRAFAADRRPLIWSLSAHR